jgi:hypothetical protein
MQIRKTVVFRDMTPSILTDGYLSTFTVTAERSSNPKNYEDPQIYAFSVKYINLFLLGTSTRNVSTLASL